MALSIAPMRVIFSLILTLCVCASLAQNTERIDSLESVLNGDPPPVDSAKAKILNMLCLAYQGKDQDKAIDYGKAALKLATAISDYEGMASSMNNIGAIYEDLGSYDKALDNYQGAMKIYEELSDEWGMARIYTNIGEIHRKQADYERALENYIKSLKLKEAILARGEDNSIKQGVANTLNNIGLVYKLQGKLDKALEDYEKALKINTELRKADPTNLVNKRETAQTYNNIGTTYFYKEDYKAAIGYYIMAKLIREEIGDKGLIAQSINNIGGVYFYQKNYKKATENFNRAYQILKEADDKKGMIGCLLNIGEVYSIKEHYEKAIEYTNQALAIAREIGSKNGVKLAYQSLAIWHARDNNYPEAYAYHQKYAAIKDSILNEKSEQAQARLSTIYETEKKERELELITKDNDLKEAELDKQNTIIWSGALGLFLIAALAFFIYTSYRQKHKANALLKEQNDEITRQKVELAKLSLVAEKTDSGVVIADQKGKIEWINDGFVRMIGYNYQEFIEHFGGSLSEISSNPDIEKVLEEIIRAKQSYSHDSSYITKNGELMWTSSTITPVFEEGGELNKIVTVYNDITKLKIAEEHIREKNKETTDSIRYAEGIQVAIMPREEEVTALLPDSFILFKPKDIVSGDFYWMTQKDDRVLYLAADCTGHGVPGAFMSMIGASMLNEVVNEKGMTNPSDIFHEVRAGFISALKQTGEIGQQKDGMDASLISLSKNGSNHFSTMELALANNPVLIIRRGKKSVNANGVDLEPILEEEDLKMYQINADKQPVGFQGNQEPYTHHKVLLEKGDMIYAFSDGYQDQFGGKKGKKFMIKRQKQMFLEICEKPTFEQKQLLDKKIEKWMANPAQPDPPAEQVDDILIIGVRV